MILVCIAPLSSASLLPDYATRDRLLSSRPFVANRTRVRASHISALQVSVRRVADIGGTFLQGARLQFPPTLLPL